MRKRSGSAPGRDAVSPVPPIASGGAASQRRRTNSGKAPRCRYLSLRLGVWLALIFLPRQVCCADITPFYSQNMSPLVQIFGLPAAGAAAVLPAGKFSVLFAADVASNNAMDATNRENILLDGESYRYTLAMRYGITDGFEGGIDIPYAGQGGGIFDNFIIGWHDFFSLPQGGRKGEPRNRLLYSYTKDGGIRLLINDSDFGLGDIRLSGGMQLYHDGTENPRAVALRASLKLPTGASSGLHGSGSTDFALWLTASDDYRLPLGQFTLLGAAGGMVMSDGDILAGQQRNLAGFGTLGFGWSPAKWIAFKVQSSGHTPFFTGSDLRELSESALQLIVGGTLAFSPQTSLDIGVSEDLAVNTTPDVAFHLALRRLF